MKYMAYIGLGSNLSNPINQINQAIQQISTLKSIQLLKQSALYQSAAILNANQQQADYINAVIKIKTDLNPLQLLKQCQQIENNQGRLRVEHWGARTLDLDILLIDDLILSTPELVIPHPRAHLRAFVLQPLIEIEPNIQIPNQAEMSVLLNQTRHQRIKKLT